VCVDAMYSTVCRSDRVELVIQCVTCVDIT